MTLLLSIVARAEHPDLATQWEAVASEVASHSAIPVPFGHDDQVEVLTGHAVARRYDTSSGSYATGAIYIDAPVEAVWVAINDAPHDTTPRVSTQRLPSPPGMRRIYSRIDLPFPLIDRHCVVEIRNNKSLYEATQGAVWQRQWTLGDPTFAPPTDDGVWITENRGAWTLIRAGEGTLALFSIRSVLGGALPASITQSWAVSTLRGALERVAERSSKMPSHYVSSHEAIASPTGGDLPTW